jgi:hypothetical protein
MKNAVEMGSGPTISIGSGIQKLIEGTHMQTYRLMGGIYEVRH